MPHVSKEDESRLVELQRQLSVQEARRKADAALQMMEAASRALDEDEDVDVWERELGMEPAPWNAPGEDTE